MASNYKITLFPGNMDLLKRVEDLSGENPFLCISCGGCSATCPLAHEMDVLPSTMMRLLQFGQMIVLNSGMIWTCSSCASCHMVCPRGIDVPKIIESLRQINLRKKVDYVHLKELPKEEIRRIPQIAIIANLRKFSA